MAVPEPPADLVQLRRDFLAAEVQHGEVCKRAPAGVEADAEQHAAESEAFAKMRELAVAIHEHAWWAEAGNRFDAEAVLRKVADVVT